MARSWFLVLGSRFWAKGKALRVAGYAPVKYDGAFNSDGIDRKINSIGQAGQAPVPSAGLSRHFTGSYGAGKIGCFSKV
jgi:hypothetical protein